MAADNINSFLVVLVVLKGWPPFWQSWAFKHMRAQYLSKLATEFPAYFRCSSVLSFALVNKTLLANLSLLSPRSKDLVIILNPQQKRTIGKVAGEAMQDLTKWAPPRPLINP